MLNLFQHLVENNGVEPLTFPMKNRDALDHISLYFLISSQNVMNFFAFAKLWRITESNR